MAQKGVQVSRISSIFVGLSIAGIMVGAACAVAPDPGEFTVTSRDSGSNVTIGADGEVIIDRGGEGGVVEDSGSIPDKVFGFDKLGTGNSGGKNARDVTAHGTNGPNPVAPSGQDCLTCHRTGGAASGKVFLFAGSIFKAKGMPQGPAVQVRIVDATGNRVGVDAFTDNDGNFWLLASSAAGAQIQNGAHVGVRNAGGIQNMSTALGMGNSSCNSLGCHDTNMPILLK